MADFTEPKLESPKSRGRSGKVSRVRVVFPTIETVTPDKAVGATYQGTVKTTFNSLVESFGEPTDYNELSDKTKAEWRLKIGDTVVLIYDYKSRKNPKRNHEWHISGFSPDALLRVAAFFPNDVTSIYARRS